MLHLLNDSDSSPIHNPLSFGPPILTAIKHVAEILGRAISPLPTPNSPATFSPLQLPVAPQVPISPRLIVEFPSTPIPAPLPRVPTVSPVRSPVPPPRVLKTLPLKFHLSLTSFEEVPVLVFPACILTITLITTTLFKPFNTIPLLPERCTTQPLANPKTLIRSSAVPTLFAGIAHSPTNGVAALRASPSIAPSTNT